MDIQCTEANEQLQTNLTRGEPVIFASYGLTGAVMVFGLFGYLCDRWLNTAPWALLGGLMIGVVGGFYGLRSVVRRR